MYSVRPRSWRRPPQLSLCQAKAPQHRRTGAPEDSAVMLSGHKWPTRSWKLPCSLPRGAPRRSNDHACARTNVPGFYPAIPWSAANVPECDPDYTYIGPAGATTTARFFSSKCLRMHRNHRGFTPSKQMMQKTCSLFQTPPDVRAPPRQWPARSRIRVGHDAGGFSARPSLCTEGNPCAGSLTFSTSENRQKQRSRSTSRSCHHGG